MLPAKQESFVRFRHFRGAGSKTSPPHREGPSSTNFISSAVATVLWAVSTARARPGFRPWWSRSTRQSQDSENATFAMARKNFLVESSDQMLPFVNQLLVRPRWLAAFLADGGLMKFENVVIPGKGPMLYADVTAALEQSVVTWDDLKWIRQAWNGPIVIKGIHTPEDARRAVDMGADALVVSNHGGRQLDGVAPTLRVLPEVVAAVGDRIEVLLDGGIRRGSDIVKALCLGARAVMVGTRVCLRTRSGGRRGCFARNRHSARGSHAHAQAAWLCVSRGTRWNLRRCSAGLVFTRLIAKPVATATRREWRQRSGRSSLRPLGS